MSIRSFNEVSSSGQIIKATTFMKFVITPVWTNYDTQYEAGKWIVTARICEYSTLPFGLLESYPNQGDFIGYF